MRVHQTLRPQATRKRTQEFINKPQQAMEPAAGASNDSTGSNVGDVDPQVIACVEGKLYFFYF